MTKVALNRVLLKHLAFSPVSYPLTNVPWSYIYHSEDGKWAFYPPQFHPLRKEKYKKDHVGNITAGLIELVVTWITAILTT
jgi:hypothetical protein